MRDSHCRLSHITFTEVGADSDKEAGSRRCVLCVPLPQCNVDDQKTENDEEADIERLYYPLFSHGVSRSNGRSLPTSSADGGVNSRLRAIGYFLFLRTAATRPGPIPMSSGFPRVPRRDRSTDSEHTQRGRFGDDEYATPQVHLVR